MVKWLFWDIKPHSYYLLMILLAHLLCYASVGHYKLKTPVGEAGAPDNYQLMSIPPRIPQDQIEFFPIEFYLAFVEGLIIYYFWGLTLVALFVFIVRNMSLRGFPDFYLQNYEIIPDLIGCFKIGFILLALIYSDVAPSWVACILLSVTQLLFLVPLKIWFRRGSQAIVKLTCESTSETSSVNVTLVDK